MVDREARKRIVGTVARHLRGDPETDNWVLDDAFAEYDGDDRSIRKIGRELWFTYDDIKRHPISVNPEGWKLYRRSIAFLMTDLELPRRRSEETLDARLWPFQSQRDLFWTRPDLIRLGLPRYDAAVHALPIRWWDFTLRLWMLPVAVVTLFAMYLLFTLFN